MRVVYLRWTYEELERPMPERIGGHPISIVSPTAVAYDTSTQAHLDLDEAVNADLCADLLARTGAYYMDADGDLAVDATWSDPMEGMA